MPLAMGNDAVGGWWSFLFVQLLLPVLLDHRNSLIRTLRTSNFLVVQTVMIVGGLWSHEIAHVLVVSTSFVETNCCIQR